MKKEKSFIEIAYNERLQIRRLINLYRDNKPDSYIYILSKCNAIYQGCLHTTDKELNNIFWNINAYHVKWNMRFPDVLEKLRLDNEMLKRPHENQMCLLDFEELVKE